MDANSDAFIEAEADIYSREQASERKRDPRLNRGEDAATLAGGFNTARDVHEQTPLLSHNADASASDGNEWPGQADFDHLPAWRRPSVFWMLPPYLLFSLAFGGAIMPKLNLVMNLICQEYYHNSSASNPSFSPVPDIDFGGGANEQCDSADVQKLYTTFLLACTLISGILSAITSPKLGALSDRYGRKMIICVTTAGMLSGEIITIVAASNPESFNVNWILVGYAIDGIAGSFIAALAIAHSYAADCTPPGRRNVAFGYFHCCLFAGIGIGPLLFGQIVKYTNSLLVIFYIALGCHLIFIFCLLFVIPESLSKRRQLAAREKYAAQEATYNKAEQPFLRRTARHFTQLLAPLKILWPVGPGSSPALRRNLVILAAIDTISFGVAMGAVSVVVIYIKAHFHWGVPEQSVYMSAVNLVRVGSLLFMLPALTRLIRGPAQSRTPQPQTGCDALDLGVIRSAILLDTLGFVGYTVAQSGGFFTVAGCIAAVGGIGGPTLQSALTKHVPHDRTGELLGASGLLHALARVISPIIFSGIYRATVDRLPQTVFLCLAITFGLASLLSWFLRPDIYLHENAHDAVPEAAHEDAES